MRSVRFGAVICGAIIAGLCVACGQGDVAPEPVIRPVRVMEVLSTGGSRDRTFSGTSQAALESRLSFRVRGTVRRIAVKVGDVVRAGQLIAELDPRDYELLFQEAEASLRSYQAQARNAEANYARVRGLYENRNASKSDLETARTGAESAVAQVSSAQKRLEGANLQLSYAKLTSPVGGSIAAVNVEVNENVSVGQPVVVLTSGSQLEVAVAIPEILIAQIRERDPVRVGFDAIPGTVFPGTVTEVGVASTGTATTFPVIVRLDRVDPACRPGMAAEVTFRFGSADTRERILVPSVAVGEDRQGRFVFVVEPADSGFGVVQRRVVSVDGEPTGEGFEVLEGLRDGERVVTAGVSRIQDGQRVRLLTVR